jgi:hypothetical protein
MSGNKKKRDKVFNRKFNSEDINEWQKLADEDIRGGNLTTWVEMQLNNVVKQRKKSF